MLRITWVWMTIWLVNAQLCDSSGKLIIRFLRLKNNKRVNNNACCESILAICWEACDIFLDICVTEVGQARCNSEKFKTKVLGKGSFTFNGDLGNSRANPLEYSFQKWQGFSLAIEIWDFDSGFLKGSSDFVDNVHLDIKEMPQRDSGSARSVAHKMNSSTSPNERYIDLEISIYCDDNFLVPDCEKECIARDDARGHYTCDYVRGLVVCNQYWYGDRCTHYCKPGNDTFGHYSCDKFGAKICAADWFGVNCSTFCKNTGNSSVHYKCDTSTGEKICQPNWYGETCGTFCKAQDHRDGHYSCNKTSGGRVCLENWFGTECTKHCSPQNTPLLGHFKCDVNGDKVCRSGWRGVNCTIEISTSDRRRVMTRVTTRITNGVTTRVTTGVTTRETTGVTTRVTTRETTGVTTVVEPSYNMQHPLLSMTTKRQTPSIYEKSTSMTTSSSITINRSWGINQPDSSTSLYVVNNPMTSEQNTHEAVVSPSVTTSNERYSTTFEEFFLSKMTPYKLTQTVSESPSQYEESFQKTEATNAYLSFSTIGTLKPWKLSKTNSIFSPLSLTQLIEYSLHNRASIVKTSISNISGLYSTTVSERAGNNLISTQVTTTQIQGVRVASPVFITRSAIMRSFSPAKRSAIGGASSSCSLITLGPVSVRRSDVTRISSSPGSLTRSAIVTSSSVKPTRSSGKIARKKENQFVVVFFPSVCFMIVVGLGICVKIRQKKLKRVQIAPMNVTSDVSEHPDARSTHILRNLSAKQEVMGMSKITAKGK
ncbi:uncharacterized protein LOC114516810 isoform X1 [Dendronephthya gigantea]|uniref:uncharacterized protein LOC114516810 isoform X1 n=1 Tax=Dendronephthya gigantea TaxID=151771 RepID=UPI00106D6A48|nr:uncharacterized protein LOC114516810 isoform X1 [Dendronephthya gigantea]